MAIAGSNIRLDSTEGMDKITTTEKITTPYFSDGSTELLAVSIVSSSLTDTNENYFFDSIKQIAQEHRDIDILINNAAITNDNLFLRMRKEQWLDVINVNLNSNFYIIKEILPNMIKNKKGNIIGITSIVAITGNPGQTNYTASKSAIISMYKSIALEVAQRNIRVNTIAPGFIITPMTNKLNVHFSTIKSRR